MAAPDTRARPRGGALRACDAGRPGARAAAVEALERLGMGTPP